jgi:hypothetical protein
MADSVEELERRIEALRTEVRRAVTSGDRARARALRADLREAEREWDDALEGLEAESADRAAAGQDRSRSAGAARAGPLLPVREQVHQALILLGVPAAHRLITVVHDAFFGTVLPGARLTSLRRDEERSFRTMPHARPYYVCAALTADLLAPARGLLAVSTWPMERRVIGPLSPRVNYLEAAIRVADSLLRVPDPGPGAARLLRRLAVNIPGAAEGTKPVQPRVVAEAARAELEVHRADDEARRREAAARARARLGDAEQLFGTRLRAVAGTGTGS